MKKLSKTVMNIDGQPMFKLLDKVKALENLGREILHFEIGDPDFPTPDNIVQAACGALGKGWTHYISSLGLPEFRQKI